MGHHRPDVILVGRRLPDNENLGLGYPLGALRDAGVPAEMAPLQDVRDVIAVAERVRRLRPRLVGLSLPDGGSSLLALGLVRAFVGIELATEIQRLAVSEAVLAADRCQDYVVTIPPGGAAPTVETMRPGTMTTRVTPAPSNPREADVVRNVAAVDTRCLGGTEVGVQRGAVRGQLDALFDKAVSGCAADRFSVVIELDAQGKVQTVTPQDPSSADAARAARCVQAAAVGMTFPCLAGYRVVPEFVIIE